jgi:hypothetical protein
VINRKYKEETIMNKQTITTRNIAEKSGMKHVALVAAVGRNMELLLQVSDFTPELVGYNTGGRNGQEYILDLAQEKLLLLLSNNGCQLVVDTKLAAAR